MFNKSNLKESLTGQFKNEVERQIFMAINVCRHSPSQFVPIVTHVAQTNELAKEQKKHTRNLIKALKTMTRLPPLYFDQQANDACTKNNRKKFEYDEKIPTKGGNIQIYQSVAG